MPQSTTGLQKTGERCTETGVYRFEQYLDGTTTPAPKPEEREIALSKSEIFPPIKSAGKGCWWKLVRKA